MMSCQQFDLAANCTASGHGNLSRSETAPNHHNSLLIPSEQMTSVMLM